jgi:hypothetical protein
VSGRAPQQRCDAGDSMSAFEFGEVFNLAFDIVIFLFLIGYLVFSSNPRRFFIFPFGFLLLSHVFTVVEGFVLPEFFNVLEHFFFLASVVFLAIGLFKILRENG